MESRKDIEISPDRRYNFPKDVVEISHDERVLIVSPLTANWIVLNNEEQLSFYRLLKDFTIEEALQHYQDEELDAQWVLIQLEARAFERLEVMKKQTKSSVHIYLTNNCNMRCPHCYMLAGERLEEELTRDEILSLLSGLSEHKIFSVVFSGGEPLLNPYIVEYATVAHNLGMEVEILTNGTLWTKEIIDKLASVVDSVQISIDGFDEESNSLVRGKGNFSKALYALDYLLDKGVPTSVAMVPKYSSSLPALTQNYINFAKSLIAKYADKPFSFNIVGEVWEGREMNLNQDEKIMLRQTVSKIFRGIYGDDSEDGSFIEFHRRFGIEENCAYGNLSISANGDVFLCAQIQPLNSIGNLRNVELSELLNISERAKEESEISKIQPCSQCAVRYICGGDCRIKYFTVFDKGEIPDASVQPTRDCSEEYRKSIYDLMIRTNEYIFQ
ncbi:radical SAM protein [Bacteroides sp. OttesenSCG-928-D19]|nr:radical SAM protein [Bacteroides sp. OttesenSCG-928-N06]MDL2303979.1 radical SAM protein [Bacteroides sp. OttesenSCG-928-D19]